MRISVKAKTNAKKELVEKITDKEFVVSVKEPPIDGRANWAICRAVAEYFGVSPSRVNVISGQSAKNKILEII
ncbi:MAG: hypothetical protein A2Z62_00155 [Candidatus Terrybacteria bacterium RIFCSPLOWO2_02_42_20]|uniref:Uncharacterized protein n=2 Tax=Candidatus Terryibacteriota TaxID=1817920 RepID=A0A1G2PLL8_9BACT|nr:MAG: hypothetical protein A2W59_00365 [Candidatus Terrybacteria bacterium RIFCSPHIGHO2_02_41_19]OHA54758.1 MAG: hypothetical protein A2Z62_00155 [Candidatus Terrybacteria bacterium RIFCSPLOWO2_02_42_20]